MDPTVLLEVGTVFGEVFSLVGYPLLEFDFLLQVSEYRGP